jgi:putative ABC transport system permease protein
MACCQTPASARCAAAQAHETYAHARGELVKLFTLAVRNLTRNRRRTAISLVALVVGVMVIVALRGYINGQQRVTREGVVEGNLGAVVVHKKGYLANVQSSPLTLDMADSPELRQRISSVEGVKALTAHIAFGAMLSMPDTPAAGATPGEPAAGKTAFLVVTAFDPELEVKVTPRRMDWLGQGHFLSSTGASELMLNADLARSLNAQVVDAKAPPPEDQWPAVLAGDRDGALNGEGVKLIGTQVSATPGDRRTGYLPLATAQRLLRMEGRVTEYALALNEVDDAAKVRDALQAMLGADYEVQTWFEVQPNVAEVLKQEDALFGIIIAIFLLVVLLGIVNVMLMNVLERVREIGTMMAVGMRRRSIVSLFLMEGAVLGLIGGIGGALVGWALVLWLHDKGIHLAAPGASVESVIRPVIPLAYLFRAVCMATIGAALAALWPAYRASRLRPVEALSTT